MQTAMMADWWLHVWYLGIDMMYAFLKHLYGETDPMLIATMNGIEYAPHTDPDWDPFSIVHNVRTSRFPLDRGWQPS